MAAAIVIYISMPVENGIYDAFDCGRDEKIVLTQELRTARLMCGGLKQD